MRSSSYSATIEGPANLDQAPSPFKFGLVLERRMTAWRRPQEHPMNRIVASMEGQPIEALAPAAENFAVLSPIGTPPKITRKTAAPRLESLDGKTICLSIAASTIRSSCSTRSLSGSPRGWGARFEIRPVNLQPHSIFPRSQKR
jgi:hypothetical protein